MSVKRNVIYNFLLLGTNILFPLITFPYVARVIGPDGIGITNFLLSYCQNFIIIAALGLSIYGTREIAKIGDDKDKRSKLFFEIITVHLLFTLILILGYGISIFYVDEFEGYRKLALLGGLHILIHVFTIEWLYQGVSDFKYIAIRSIIVRTLSAISMFIFIKTEDDYSKYFAIIVFSLLLNVIININYARKYIVRPKAYSFREIFPHLRPIFILGIYMVLNSVNGQARITLLGFMSTTESVGYFAAASKIIGLMIAGFMALTQVMFPKMNSIVNTNESEEYRELIDKMLNIVMSIGIPISFFVFFAAEPLVNILAGDGFAASVSSIRIMSPLIFIIALAQVLVLLILTVKRKDKQIALNTFFGLLVGLIILVIFIPKFSEDAAAGSQLISELLITSVAFILARREFKFQFPGKLALLNLLYITPISVGTYFFLQIIENVFYQLIVITLVWGLYFIIYQVFFIKNPLIVTELNSILKKAKTKFK